MRHLITGGYGYVGAYAASRAAAGNEIFILSRGPKRDAPFAHEHIQADLTTVSAPELARLLPEDLDGCLHLAALNDSADPEYPRQALAANAFGTRTLLEALHLRGGLPHFVYLSTFHVYGRAGGNIDESTPPAPRNDYALTHLFAEEYGRMFARVHSLPFSTARLTNGYGAPLLSDPGPWRLICNDLCRQAVQEGKITLKAHPKGQRDFVRLADADAALITLLERRDLAGGLYNIASGRTVTLGEVAETAQRAAQSLLGREIPLILEGRDEAPAGEPLCVSAEAARRDLGLEAGTDMESEMRAIFKAAEAQA